MPEKRSTGRSADRRRREQLIRQVIRARRTVEAETAAPTTPAVDPAQLALAARAKQRVQGDPPHGAVPGGTA